MNELTVISRDGVEVVDSRDVAKMVERNHKDLLRDIRGYIDVMKKSEEISQRKIAPSDFFIESSFDNRGKEYPCYLLTKKGCDMVANKMTGEKGVLFTAAYVTAFEKMRESLQRKQLPPDKAALAEAKAKNARARMASMWLKLAQTNPVPTFQQICAHYERGAERGRGGPAPAACTGEDLHRQGGWGAAGRHQREHGGPHGQSERVENAGVRHRGLGQVPQQRQAGLVLAV